MCLGTACYVKGSQKVLDRLSEFHLPEYDRERVEQLRRAVSSLDWDRINEILS